MTTDVALGSSVAAGPGIEPILDAGCGRSGSNYAHVGGNDVEYLLTLLRCSYKVAPEAAPPGAGAFFGTPVDPAAVDTSLAALPAKLATLIAAVRERASRARVVLVDHLTILPAEGGCAALPMRDDDVRLCAGIGRRLEAATAEVARATGVELVEASAISRGHTVCDPEPWVTGWEFGDLLAGGVGPHHPNAAGMRAVAEAITGRLSA